MGKLALITGASSGIGAAIAEALAKEKISLYLVARRAHRLDNLARELSRQYSVTVQVKQLDVRNREDVHNFGEELKKAGLTPDILVNSAGLAAGKEKFYEADIDDWDAMIDTNLKGLLYVSRAIAPLMIAKGSGHIINIGSLAGEEAYVGGSVYNATKFGVRAISKAMNLDLVDTNIKVSNIAPGMVNTEFSLVRFKGDESLADSVYEGVTPLTGADIANAVSYILNLPDHMTIPYMTIMPKAQRSSTSVRRG